MVHELKTIQTFFEKIISGKKRFEIRKNDRDFQEGDFLRLREFDPIKQKYTGQEIDCKILYVLPFNQFLDGIKEGYCIMSIETDGKFGCLKSTGMDKRNKK